jgi:hypothetical protein
MDISSVVKELVLMNGRNVMEKQTVEMDQMKSIVQPVSYFGFCGFYVSREFCLCNANHTSPYDGQNRLPYSIWTQLNKWRPILAIIGSTQ